MPYFGLPCVRQSKGVGDSWRAMTLGSGALPYWKPWGNDWWARQIKSPLTVIRKRDCPGESKEATPAIQLWERVFCSAWKASVQQTRYCPADHGKSTVHCH